MKLKATTYGGEAKLEFTEGDGNQYKPKIMTYMLD